IFVSRANEDSVDELDASGHFTRVLAGADRFGIRGHDDGIGQKSRMMDPRGIAFDAATNALYVAEYENALVRRIDLASHRVTTFAGKAETYESMDGPGMTARFRRPQPLVLDGRASTIIVGDEGALRGVSVSTGEVSTLVGSGDKLGFENGIAVDARFAHPE